VKSLTTLVPTPEVATAFDTVVELWIARVLSSCNESRSLAALRDTLLPKLLSGEIHIKDAERLVEAAT
jgi:type I restriction enzyme S subunit